MRLTVCGLPHLNETYSANKEEFCSVFAFVVLKKVQIILPRNQNERRNRSVVLTFYYCTLTVVLRKEMLTLSGASDL